MSDLLSSVALVISYFITWLSDLTSTLIQNPVIQLVFAFPIIFTIIYFIVSLILSIFNSKNNSSSGSSVDSQHLLAYDYLKKRYSNSDDDYDDDTYDTGYF